MNILIRANPQQKQIILAKPTNSIVQIEWYNGAITDADAYVDFLFAEDEANVFEGITNKLVFVNVMLATCKNLPNNFVRINGWNYFIENETIECACIDDLIKEEAIKIFNILSWKHLFVSDEIGMLAAPAIAMIINEAYFALQDNVSTKQEIDIAMKLGTNYPYGPFEWANKIGIKNVAQLLIVLSSVNSIYKPSSLLLQESNY